MVYKQFDYKKVEDINKLESKDKMIYMILTIANVYSYIKKQAIKDWTHYNGEDYTEEKIVNYYYELLGLNFVITYYYCDGDIAYDVEIRDYDDISKILYSTKTGEMVSGDWETKLQELYSECLSATKRLENLESNLSSSRKNLRGVYSNIDCVLEKLPNCSMASRFMIRDFFANNQKSVLLNDRLLIASYNTVVHFRERVKICLVRDLKCDGDVVLMYYIKQEASENKNYLSVTELFYKPGEGENYLSEYTKTLNDESSIELSRGQRKIGQKKND